MENPIHKKIEELDFSTTALKKFKAAKISTLEEITNLTESDAAYLLNKKSFIELVEIMKRYELRFKPLF